MRCPLYLCSDIKIGAFRNMIPLIREVLVLATLMYKSTSRFVTRKSE